MNIVVDILHALTPDAQLILMLSIFTLVVLVAASPEARSNIRDFLSMLKGLFSKKRIP